MCGQSGLEPGSPAPAARRPSPLGGVDTSSGLKPAPSAQLLFLFGLGPSSFLQPGEGVSGDCGLTWSESAERKAIRDAHPFLTPFRTPHVGSCYLKAPRQTQYLQPKEGYTRLRVTSLSAEALPLFSASPCKSLPGVPFCSGKCILVYPEEE